MSRNTDRIPINTLPEAYREKGRELIMSPSSSREDIDRGLSLMNKAALGGDPAAMYFIGRVLYERVIVSRREDSRSRGLEWLCRAADMGWVPARTYLEKLRRKQHDGTVRAAGPGSGPLTDFDQRPVRIDRSGVFTPVDAVLRYENGENTLTFSVDLGFLMDEKANPENEKLIDAVIRGIRMWEGEYAVFGGQRLRVRFSITVEEKRFDQVMIVVCNGFVAEQMQKMLKRIDIKRSRETMKRMFRDNRAGAISGLKWSVRSRKIIYLRMYDGNYEDYEEISHVIKHEFGHVLGLGDLYAEPEAGLEGVQGGTYYDLDPYMTSDRFYRLVMCDHHAPVTDNDIEMAVLAFSENRSQEFQPTPWMKKVSKALGRGD